MWPLPHLWTWLAVAIALEPIDALTAAARRVYEEGRAHEAGGDPSGAAVRYRAVVKLEPTWTQALVDLGRVLEATGRWEDAAATYERAPWNPDAVEALGRLHLGRGEFAAAAQSFVKLRDLRSDTPEFLVLEAHALSGVDPLAAVAVLEEFLGRPAARLSTPDGLVAAGAIASALHARGDPEACRRVVSLAQSRLDEEQLPPDDPARVVLAELADRFAVEDEAARLARAADVPLTPDQRVDLARARSDLRAGRVEAAFAALARLTAEAPRSAVAWGAMADAANAAGDVSAADRASSTAERLDPLDPVHPERLGDLLASGYAGRYDAEAVAAYARALSRPDAPADLWYRRAQLEVRLGERGAAGVSLRRYLDLDPHGPHAPAARALLLAIDRPRPAEDPGSVAWSDLTESDRRYWVALVLARPPRGAPPELDRALAELHVVLDATPGDLRALVLAAEIHAARGAPDLAIELYERCLLLAPERGDLHAVLSDLHRAGGRSEIAERLLAAAAERGDPGAVLTLAERDLTAWRLYASREKLLAIASAGTSNPTQEARLDALQRSWARRTAWSGAGAAAVGSIAVGVPLARRFRRRWDAPLQRLLDAHPSVWPEVARILSAVRHEVLKHHTSSLDAVADALERGDPEPAAWAAERLGGARGAVQRFREATHALERLGRAHGVRVELRHADPVFAPLIAAMDRLERLLPDLRRGARRAAGPLREVSEALNGVAYPAVGSLLNRLCLLPVDRDAVLGAWNAVAAELRLDQALDLELPARVPLVRIYRAELGDVLTNLLRNAVEASRGEPMPNVGVRVALEDDPITGLERVEIRVRDRAPKRLSTAMIRSRSIGRGLGLAVDLIARNGGSIHVEPEPGWAKAVVVRLPRAETPEEAS